MVKNKKISMAIPLLLFLISNVSSVENSMRTVFTYTILPEDESLYTLGDVINDSIMLELKIAGFETEHTAGKKEMFEISSMMESTKETGSRFLILNSYELNDDQIIFKIDCYETEQETLLISIEKEEQIGFFLDSAINESMSEVINKIEKNIPAEDLQKDPEKSIFIPENNIEKETDNTYGEDKKILLSAAVSPFMTTGKAGQYFTHGWEFYLFGGYPLNYRTFDFTAGLFVMVNRFNSVGVLISSENTFLTFGPEIRVTYELNNKLSFFTNAALGGTIFMLKSEVEDTQSTLIPHISAGGGIVNSYSKSLSGFLHLRYSLYFEESLLITGFSPALGVNYRL